MRPLLDRFYTRTTRVKLQTKALDSGRGCRQLTTQNAQLHALSGELREPRSEHSKGVFGWNGIGFHQRLILAPNYRKQASLIVQRKSGVQMQNSAFQIPLPLHFIH
jgi:hypothetical protein